MPILVDLIPAIQEHYRDRDKYEAEIARLREVVSELYEQLTAAKTELESLKARPDYLQRLKGGV